MLISTLAWTTPDGKEMLYRSPADSLVGIPGGLPRRDYFFRILNWATAFAF